jgi:tRNA-binding EMAP/Myf-like protein
VLSVEDHPADDAPKNWHKVTVTMDNKTNFNVICGGTDYKAGDIVAYIPVGGKLGDKLVEEKDMKGEVSQGLILAKRELGIAVEVKKPAGGTAAFFLCVCVVLSFCVCAPSRILR